MANIKSAKKRILVTSKKQLRNKTIKSALKTSLKKFNATVQSGDKTAAEALLPSMFAVVDKAATKGIIHKNAAAHKKSQLAISINKMA